MDHPTLEIEHSKSVVDSILIHLDLRCGRRPEMAKREAATSKQGTRKQTPCGIISHSVDGRVGGSTQKMMGAPGESNVPDAAHTAATSRRAKSPAVCSVSNYIP